MGSTLFEPIYGTSGKCRVDMDDVTFYLCVDQDLILSNLRLEDPIELMSLGLYIKSFGEELKQLRMFKGHFSV
jgi:hypothetical protein